MIQIPDWVKDTIFYQIFPDRFAKSARVPKPNNLETWDSRPSVYGFKGGDLLGVAEHLDYLQELGITAIYFTPIFQSTANHRYHTHDYYRIDSILGGEPAFRELLKAAQARSMRVIIDGVFNHASRGFYQFNHILENGAASPYVDWFNVKGYPLHAYEGKPVNYDAWWGIPALPKLNTKLPAVREFIFGVAEYWIRQGVDGWRLDVPGEINDDTFWQEFRQRVKAINPDAYIVGEIWHEAQRWLQGDQFDGVMNYQLTKACIGFFIGQDIDEALTTNVGFQAYPPLDASAFAYTVNHLLRIYDPAVVNAQMNLLDSHDTARFISIAKGDQNALRIATLFQMTCPGAPSVYYGNEIGMLGGKDPDCRRAFPWDTPGKWDTKLLQYFKDCIALRKRYTALRYGQFRFIFAEGHAIAYLRSLGDQKFIVVINAGAETTINIIIHPEFGLPEGATLVCMPAQQSAYQVRGGLISGVHIGKRDGFVLMAQPHNSRGTMNRQTTHPPDIDQTLEQIRDALDKGSIDDAIQLLDRLKQNDRVEVFDELDLKEQADMLPRMAPDESADLLAELDQEDQADIAERIDDQTLSRILDEMEPDDAADVIGDLPEQRQEQVLANMSDADDVRPLLIHPDESAGGLMTTSFITLRPGMTAQAAIEALRNWNPDTEVTYYLFVVDRDRKLVGVVSLRQLITAPPDKLIAEIMNPNVISVTAGTDQEECARLLQEHNLLALPVVDVNNVLLGVITVDDLVDVIEEEATEDVYRLGGVPDEDYPLSPVPFSLRRRLPWLYINLGTAFLAAWVVSLFQSTIAQVAILAALQSIVAGQGGNAATQTITIMVRGIALGEINRGNALKALGKEAVQGLLQGLAVALIVGAGVALWQHNLILGCVIGLAMVGNLIVAGVTGALVPLVLKVFHIDPALASSVIVTTFTDCAGFAFSLGLATLLIQYLR